MDVAIAELIAMVLTITIVGLLLVSIPITRRLGRALEEWIRIRSEGAVGQAQIDQARQEIRSLAHHLDALEDRLQLLSERQDFTESLVDKKTPSKSLGPGAG